MGVFTFHYNNSIVSITIGTPHVKNVSEAVKIAEKEFGLTNTKGKWIPKDNTYIFSKD